MVMEQRLPATAGRPPLGGKTTVPSDGDSLVELDWLVRLRWSASALGAAGSLVAWGVVGLDLPIVLLLLVCALLGASNAVLDVAIRRRRRAPSDRWLGVVAVVDIGLITAFLALSGGPMNPFSVLYVVYIGLGAMLLAPEQRWMLVALSSGAYATLFFVRPPTPAGHGHGVPSGLEMHLVGMWAAYTLAAIVLNHLVARVSDALSARERELRRAREQTARDQRLAALTTLAAGAAHELGSPLATIAVSAGELENALRELDGREDLVADARLVRSEVRRCRDILDQMAAEGRDMVGEGLATVHLARLIAAVREESGAGSRLRVETDPDLLGSSMSVPRRALTRVLGNLVENALAAAPQDDTVLLRIARSEDRWSFEVRDRGLGMAPDVLARASEPFFTTRPPGRGLGLGLFLARTVAEQLGGGLALVSTPGQGTVASLELPA